MEADAYNTFLESKAPTASRAGLEVEPQDLHESLFPFQRDAVRWALRGGRRALFEGFGLGKTRQQLEMLRQIQQREGGRQLIVCPLAVIPEFQSEAEALGMTPPPYVRSEEEAEAACAEGQRVHLTNYTRVRDGHLPAGYVAGYTSASLDEASVLRGYGTKTYQEFLPLFEHVPYRFVATATPSPNRFKELIHYAAFLGVMDTAQALTRFFKRNSQKAGDLTIYPHKEREFWLWVSTWALFIRKPSDLGYSDDGYDLPPANVHWHEIEVSHEDAGVDNWGQRRMFRQAVLGLQEAAREKRDTLPLRLEKAHEIMEAGAPEEESERHWILWHHLERERKAIEKAFEQATTVYGSQDPERRADLLRAFADGETSLLATKPSIAGSGCNLQRHCSDAIFLGIDYGFNDFIQALHRIQRFGQDEPVDAHIIYADSEQNIRRVLEEKWEKHERLSSQMTTIIRKHGLSDASKNADMRRKIGRERREREGQHYRSVCADCVEETRRMATESVDMICTSIPFGTQYEYCESYNDFGHNEDNGRFFDQMDFLVPELLRVLKPGRVAAVHAKDRVRFGSKTGLGFPTVDRFSDQTADAFERHGFHFFGRIVITTDVVRENNQTYRLGWSEQCKDGTKMGVGMPEYVMLFRKAPTDLSDSYADEPVAREKDDYPRRQWQIDAHAHWRSGGDRLLRPSELASMSPSSVRAWYERYSRANVYDYDAHVEMGRELEERGRLPASFMLLEPPSHRPDVWTDVTRMRTLNTGQSQRREMQHVCPLQLDVVERLIDRFSAEDETIYDPFAGLMTVPYVAVESGRDGVGVELNEEYWRMGNDYLRAAEAERAAPTLFDALSGEAEGEDMKASSKKPATAAAAVG